MEQRLESPSDLITVQTVYELASNIGEQFKKLLEVEPHGPELNQTLIPTVVRVLEYLEDAVVHREGYLHLVDKLHRQIEELQRGQQERTQQQLKYQSEIEDIDESWRKENIQLSQYVTYLRRENKRLTSSLSESFTDSLTDLKHDSENDEEKCRLMESKLDKQKKRISLLSSEIELKNEEIDSLKKQSNSLYKENQHLQNVVLKIHVDASREAQECKEATEDVGSHDERVLLREKIRSLEDVIDMYKMKLDSMESSLMSDDTNSDQVNNNDADNEEKVEESSQIEEEEEVPMEDLPVQGPIPKEPDEKLFYRQRRKSRIWSFFPRLTRAFTKTSPIS